MNQEIDTKKRKSKVKRSKRNNKNEKILKIMYSNIQGVTKKKESLIEIMEDVDCDICLLAETMTNTFKIPGCRCITSRKSVGQNVCIILRRDIKNERLIKLYEPNDTANMIGIRIACMNKGIRIYTAHLKQLSTNSRDEIKDQFEEVRNQFNFANSCGEAMIMMFDANVHVGNAVIDGCPEKQDWGGKLLMGIVEEENLVVMNSDSLCTGVITRVDPRNNVGSCIDLVLVNEYVYGDMVEMSIDEKGIFKPANYEARTKKVTDHNTIILKARVERTKQEKQKSYINTKCEFGRENFCQLIAGREEDISNIYMNRCTDLSIEFERLETMWDDVMKEAFDEIMPRKKKISGIDTNVRVLMREERRIRETVLENPERGRLIFEIRKKIHEAISCNRAKNIILKIEELQNSKNPQREIFRIRRERQARENLAFPLKDRKGNTHVTKVGIDKVVKDHFQLVFAQNPKPKGELWEMYWKEVDDLFDCLIKKTGLEAARETVVGPSLKEITDLISSLNTRKAVTGKMSGDLMKLGGAPIAKLVHRCIYACFMQEDIPIQMKVERIVLLYKNSGAITDMDNYRGIFLRYLILSLMQKWLYQKCSPTVDVNGTEYAFGGRIKRSVRELLLVVKLVQDHANWTKRPLVLKFLDIRKFFDTMNFKTALIEAYKSGIKGKYWRIYKSINERKTCTPYTPLGDCGEIDVEEVFVQGSSDAMLMAWNLVDGLNKKSGESIAFDPICYVEGVEIPRCGFIDDLLEVARGVVETQISCITDEVFEKQNCLLFKPSKCKIILQNLKKISDKIMLDGEELEIVEKHKYLGTIVESCGRAKDLQQRISDCKGVLNEIVELCKMDAVSLYRFQYMSTLLRSCFMQKFKHGCEAWGDFSKRNISDINKLIPQTIKRVLELPRSSPTNAVKHDFGLVDLTCELDLEKILLASDVLDMCDKRIAKKLLFPMIEKEVPGFCTQLSDILLKYEISLEDLAGVKNKREVARGKIVDFEKVLLQQSMLMGSKTDHMLAKFQFNGKMLEYLKDLSFDEGRIVFMFRSRMFPTRVNYPNRWTSLNCQYCSLRDTDKHLFSCWGYLDIIDDIDYLMFYNLDVPMKRLSAGAQVLLRIYERLSCVQDDKDLVSS